MTTFVPDETGKKFNPHVTIGLATQDYLKKMLDEKFEPFTFSPAGASVYHLGNFGTAQKKLKGWDDGVAGVGIDADPIAGARCAAAPADRLTYPGLGAGVAGTAESRAGSWFGG